MDYITLSNQAFIALSCSFILALLVILIVRSIIKNKSPHGLRRELAQKDNFAMGISYAATLFTVLVVTGFLFKNLSFTDIQADAIYGFFLMVFAFAYIHLGKSIHAKIILKDFNEEKEIQHKNICAALVESGVMIGNGVLILGLYNWSHAQSLDGLLILAVTFIQLQFFLYLNSRWHEYLFSKANQGSSLQNQFKFENISLGLRYGGQTLGTCLAIYAGLASTNYFPGKMVENLLMVALHCGILIFLQQFLSALAIRLALPKINTESEIDQQDNIGIASIELAVYIAVGLLLVKLF
ncbi:hypothetical protein [Pseudoalteromonas denitrificans]|uniref:DUF350 domain-containing protein n=1 Tax=Pseudoalteromonas denitrificans DSM 6059 TaxID=1123010 RepID=A0A1I1EA91_9GAMM|nr:hypothetical protein [Pseudoalteromonas denitrificans]SFB81873.1 hypothetical protein SAMN02745724_00206 [Pseudoalteromonas denitrificans DSM 6059]